MNASTQISDRGEFQRHNRFAAPPCTPYFLALSSYLWRGTTDIEGRSPNSHLKHDFLQFVGALETTFEARLWKAMKAGWDEGEARAALEPWLITIFCFSYLTTASSAGLKALIRMFCFFWEKLDVLSFAPLLGGASFLALVFIPLGPVIAKIFLLFHWTWLHARPFHPDNKLARA